MEAEKLKELIKNNKQMKKYATAYVSFFENEAKANIIEAENEIDAMKKTILTNEMDTDMKAWLDGLGEISIKDFKVEIAQCEQSVDAIEIK